MIDTSVIEQLKYDVGDSMAIELLNVFVDESKKLVAQMLASTKPEEIELYAHSLKSSGYSFGATRLAQTCQLIEQQVKVNGLDTEVATLLKLADAQSKKTFEHMNELIQNH
ncbi:HPt (histidine-containing phosphotransfer) domain-containing protein [Pseudoalteromonas sp. DSM 26666]|uniref:Hpt domain-containing protein n=1 Tax=Pseudoalteromonas sp. DSM 26666 TaxID=1761892 RepID=UPI0008E9C02B|nr:Hpt domain-containing protein [Pseudoalteromonas sp. DSM 26666]SFU10659.1 HPt (histidine-containing phosphotransfer) domain-containing protein [Pseudoalteromonas sp. DSM 26666]